MNYEGEKNIFWQFIYVIFCLIFNLTKKKFYLSAFISNFEMYKTHNILNLYK